MQQSQHPTVVIIRGPAGVGKSTVSSILCQRWKERKGSNNPVFPVAYLEQVYFRNVIAGGQAGSRELSTSLLLQAIKTCYDAKYHVVVEGILNVKYCLPMLEEVLQHCGSDHVKIYYLDASLALTQQRHLTRSKANVFGIECLAEWYSAASPCGIAGERIIDTSVNNLSADTIVNMILGEVATTVQNVN